VKGEFEKRLRQVIDEIESSPKPIILFIDEAHTLIGAGGQAGTGDAANLLKPALARGRLRTIAATTWSEYRQYFEKDPALTRRFQTVNVGEPDTEVAISMLRSVASAMEKHHKVVILDEAVEAAVKLSQRYVPARQLPDKAVSLLDTAGARVAVSQHATPAPVESRRRRIELLNVELEIATREAEGQYAGVERIGKLKEAIEEAQVALDAVEAKWAAEKDCRRRDLRSPPGLDGRLRERRRHLSASRPRSTPPCWPSPKPMATIRWCSARSTPTRSPPSSATGPASPSAAWSRTRSPRS
jgi:type VI secretion system protein VasG